ncbi:hypothetical protein Cme02nite_47460 [Catellatospora methionotrophica]|uniref:Uncharacterized protein n=1 Tax=Catellatospora methionotrophica TaxID=121620 RepID=A0A8J3PH67_9ACTN|nr:hypothetical protein Cme02nite_47460 [Catellatospora methionotrophica]
MRSLWSGGIRRGELGLPVRDNQVLYAVRRDWRHPATHEYLRPRLTEAEAIRAAFADHRYWRRGPMRPRLSVVRISANDLRIHRWRRDCMAPDCPR